MLRAHGGRRVEHSLEHRLEHRRIAIITGGGDCPGLNAVIRGAVHRLIREHDVRVYGSEDAFNGLLDDPQRVRALDFSSVSGILSRGGTILGTTNRGDPFAFPTSKEGEIELEDRSAELAARIQDWGFEGLICIGGDGTLAIADRLSREHGINVVGVPKTIDNDVADTDFTFGFWTAVQRATDAFDALHSTAESHDRIMVVELMGRDAGHLALFSGVAGGADVILIPEIPYDLEVVTEHILRRKGFGLTFSIVAVAEGAADLSGSRQTKALSKQEITGRLAKLGGIGEKLARRLTELTSMESRVVVLGHLQRGGSPVAFDRVLATAFGVAAADAAAAGRYGIGLSLHTPDIVEVPMADLLQENRKVDVEGTFVRAARGVGICLGDESGG